MDGIELERLKTSFSQKQTLEGQAEGYLDYAEFYRDSYPELSSAYLEVSKMVTEYAGGNDALQPQIDALLFGPIRELRRQVVVCQ